MSVTTLAGRRALGGRRNGGSQHLDRGVGLVKAHKRLAARIDSNEGASLERALTAGSDSHVDSWLELGHLGKAVAWLGVLPRERNDVCAIRIHCEELHVIDRSKVLPPRKPNSSVAHQKGIRTVG